MKKRITIKEALKLAQSGDNDAMISLLKKYQPLIAKGIGQAIANDLHIDDLENILFLKMIEMLKKFDTKTLK